jgi:hypothetical protein
MTDPESLLRQEYVDLLAAYGVANNSFQLSSDQIKASVQEAKSKDARDGMSPRGYTRMLKAKSANDAQEYFSKLTRMAIKASPTLNDRGIHTFTGLFPTGSINAQARTAENGYLILINTGLVGFFQQFIGILVRYAAVQDRLFNDNFVRQPTERLDRNTVINIYGELITGFLTGRPLSWRADTYLFTGGLLGTIFHILNTECLLFVHAHEHAHVVLGHLGAASEMKARSTPVGNVDFIAKNWSDELSADYIGTYIKVLVTHMTSNNPNPEALGEMAKWIYAGISLFFCIDGIITKATERILQHLNIAVPVITDHPPADRRMKEVRRYFVEGQANDAVFEVGNDLVQPFEQIEDAVINSIVSRVGASVSA